MNIHPKTERIEPDDHNNSTHDNATAAPPDASSQLQSGRTAVVEDRPHTACEADGCNRNDRLRLMDRLPSASRAEFHARQYGDAEGEVYLYCPYHRKHALGVTS